MKTVIEMARQVGFHVGDQFVAGASEAELERFAELVRADEREKFCAVLRQLHDSYSLLNDPNAIRARSET